MTVTFNDDQQKRLFETLGLPDDTDPTDADAILAVIEDLATQAAEAQPVKPSEVAAAAKRIGFEAVDDATLTALRADAAEGRQIKASVAKAQITDQVTNAVRTGKITADRREHWVNLITADPAMAQVLAAVPEGTAVPVGEVGHGVDNSDDGLVETAPWFR